MVVTISRGDFEFGFRTAVLFAAVAIALIAAEVSSASCLPQTAAGQRARASVIFEGFALEGPTPTGIQRFRATRYLKGTGPRIVRVATGVIRKADGSGTITSVSLQIKRGERWRIFARGKPKYVLESNQCSGSRKL